MFLTNWNKFAQKIRTYVRAAIIVFSVLPKPYMNKQLIQFYLFLNTIGGFKLHLFDTLRTLVTQVSKFMQTRFYDLLQLQSSSIG